MHFFKYYFNILCYTAWQKVTMTTRHESLSATTEEPPDFAAELDRQLSTHYPEVAFDEPLRVKLLQITGIGMDSLYQRYGRPDAPERKEYHNHAHTRGVVLRSLWNINYTLELFKQEKDPRHYAVVILAAQFHDFVVGHAGKIETITIPFGDMLITIENDGQKTDEAMSVECALQVLHHYGLEEYSDDVTSGIFATEVIYVDGRVIPTERANACQKPTDQAIRVADTGRIFADGVDGVLDDVSKLALEMAGDAEKPDATQIGKIILDILTMQQSFVDDRIKIFKTAAAQLPFGSEQIVVATEYVETAFRARITDALAFTAAVGSNIDKLGRIIQAKLEKTDAPIRDPATVKTIIREVLHEIRAA